MKIRFTKIAKFIQKNYIFICTILIFTCLSILGAVKHPLSSDEGQTAFYGKSIIKYGIPYGWNGYNIDDNYGGYLLDNHLINFISPWLQFYITALSFLLFGISTFTARLPFIIVSIISVYLTYYLAKTLFSDKKIALLTIILLSINIPFLLFSYQVRYYSLSTLFTIALFILFKRLSEGKKNIIFLLAVVIILYFHTHSISMIAMVSALSGGIFFLKPDFIKTIKKLLITLFFSSLIIIPWIIITKPIQYNQQYFLINANLLNTTELFLRYLYDLQLEGGISIILIPILIILINKEFKKKGKSKPFFYILVTSFLYILFSSILSVQKLNITTHSDIRYIMNIYPILMIITSSTIIYIYNKFRYFGILLIVLTLFTNILNFTLPIHFYLTEYFGEIFNIKYQNSIHLVTEFLDRNSEKNDQVFVSPDYYSTALLFYLGEKIEFVNRISPKWRYIEKNRDILPKYVYDTEKPPRWLVFFSKYQQFDSRPLPSVVNIKDYEEIRLPVFAPDTTRPEIFVHSFYPVTVFDEQESVFIYKLKTAKKIFRNP